MTAEDPRAVSGHDVEQLYAVIGGLLRRTLPSLFDIGPEEAEAAVWETFICYLTSRPPIQPADWITAGAIDEARAQRSHSGVPLVAPPDPASTPFQRAMASLSERERAAVELALRRDMPPEAIAEALDITPLYARKLVDRATDKLRKHLEE